MSEAVADLTTQSLHWMETSDVDFPYATTFEERSLRLRLNDFPAEPFFTVMDDDVPLFDVEGFGEGWPTSWTWEASSK